MATAYRCLRPSRDPFAVLVSTCQVWSQSPSALLLLVGTVPRWCPITDMRRRLLCLALYLVIQVSSLTAQPARRTQPAPDFALRFDHKGCHYEYLDTFKGTYSHIGAAHPVPIALTDLERQKLFDAIQAADFFNQPTDRGVGKEPANFELEVRNAGTRHTVRLTGQSSWIQSEAGRPLRNLIQAIYEVLEKQPAVLSLPARGDGCNSGPPPIR